MKKIELIERSMVEKRYIISENNLSIFENNELVFSKEIINFNDILKLVNSHSVFWKEKYIKKGISLDSNVVEINIYDNDNKNSFYFEDQFPIDYFEFLNKFKGSLGVL